jgi:predicted O-methyltransferase YrrM
MIRLRTRVSEFFNRFATRADIDNLYLQISCLLEIRDILGGQTGIGPLRDWAISPDALLILLRAIERTPSPRIVEFGAGESTIAMAAALKRRGDGSLITIEHDEKFALEIRERLRSAGLESRADVRVVSLRQYPARWGLPAFQSYQMIPDGIPFDIALIDGPIAHVCGAGTRGVPLEWCISKLERGSVIYLDDAARRGERAILTSLCRAHPHLRAKQLGTERGIVELTVCT